MSPNIKTKGWWGGGRGLLTLYRFIPTFLYVCLSDELQLEILVLSGVAVADAAVVGEGVGGIDCHPIPALSPSKVTWSQNYIRLILTQFRCRGSITHFSI